MFKSTLCAVVIMAAVVFSVPAHAAKAGLARVISVSGTVASVNAESGVLEVQTTHGIMVFYISTESALLHGTSRMSSIEIMPKDPVIVQYITSLGRNNVVNLVDNRKL